MPFNFNPKRTGPKQHDGRPTRALLDEVRQFAAERRKYNLRRFAGLEKDEAPAEEKPQGAPEMEAASEECEACAKGECDMPEHMSEEEAEALEALADKPPEEEREER